MVSLPLILLLTLTSVDFGRAIHCYSTLTNAARAGAQYGASHGHTDYSYSDWEEEVFQATLTELEGSIAGGGDAVTIQVLSESGAAEGSVTVVTDCPFSTIIDWPGFPPEIPIQTRCTMRRYR